MAKESRSRSLAKSTTYRVLIVMTDLVVVYFLTKRTDVTLGVTVFTNIASALMYYGHERAWNYISWGRKK